MVDNRIVFTSTQCRAGVKISVCQYQPTDRPIEDRHSISWSEDAKRLIVGVYDGHNGFHTAECVSTSLPTSLLRHPPQHHCRIFQETDDTMIRAFREDHSFLSSKSGNWVNNAKVVKSGCTALVLDINIPTLTVTYANAGDCRAVLSTTETPLFETVDLNASNPAEQARLTREHPGEDLFISSMRSTGRLFGRIMTTRGFGDACYKLPLGFRKRQHRKYIDALSSVEDPGKLPMNAQYHSMFHLYRTPPYLTAVPDVGVVQIPLNAFIIIATDGLWSGMSSRDAAAIVSRGITEGVDDLTQCLLKERVAANLPGDDTTIGVLHFLPR